MAGEADPMTPPEDSQDIAAALGGTATVVRIPGAAHTVLRDQPDAAHRALRDFLRSLPQD
jgi:proline iminopeptidase